MPSLSTKTQELKSEKITTALYIVATPIGNLSDITLRALDVLKKVEVILCEDIRVSMRLLKAYEIEGKQLLTYNDYSDEKTRQKILGFLQNEQAVALISDAGTPLISDPGFKLVSFLRQFNKKIIPIPGPSSALAALCASGLACDNFLFVGFMPNHEQQRKNFLENLPKDFTLVFFESPQRLVASLKNLREVFGNQKAAVARELTKIHEEILSENLEDLEKFFVQNPEKIRGEMVIVVQKADRNSQNFKEEDLISDIKKALAAKESLKDLSQNLAKIYKINKKDVYKLALEHQE